MWVDSHRRQLQPTCKMGEFAGLPERCTRQGRKLHKAGFPLVFHDFSTIFAYFEGKSAIKCNSDLAGATSNNFNRLSGCKHLQQPKKLPYLDAQVNCNLLQQAKNLIISRRGCHFTHPLHSSGRQRHIYISSFVLSF